MNGTREVVLTRVRSALSAASGERASDLPDARQSNGRDRRAETQVAAVGAGAVREPDADPGGQVELLAARLLDYGAQVIDVAADDVAPTLDSVLTTEGVVQVAVPPDLPAAWRPPSLTVVDDHGLGAVELDERDGAVTGSTLAIAETGTLLLTGGPTEGRRALTLVPDLHVCIVERSSVVADAGAALVAVAPLVSDERRPLTFISGPSATSDIELHRVEGVHGPRRLVVLIVAD